MSTEIVKKPRIKKKGEETPFTVLKPIERGINITMRYSNEYTNTDDWSNSMSPYSKFIPVFYLSRGHISEGIAPFRQSVLSNSEAGIARLNVNKYLFYNKMEQYSHKGTSTMRYDKVLNAIRTFDYWYSKFIAKYYICHSYFHSLFIEKDDQRLPCAIMAVPRENLLKVKLGLLRGQMVDTSDCVYFVDKAIDSTSYWNLSFRTMFRKYIEPYLKSLNILICKVPVEYIQENCFVPDVKLKETNIFKRKEEIEQVKKEFISSLKNMKGICTKEVESTPEIVSEGSTTTYGDNYEWRIPEGYSLSADPHATASHITVDYNALERAVQEANTDDIVQQLRAAPIERRIQPMMIGEEGMRIFQEALMEQGQIILRESGEIPSIQE